MTGKQRMLNAYRGLPNDRPAVAPEFWYYYPAKVLGVDMIEFQREVPFHRALKTTFEHFGCEGWGAAFFDIPVPGVTRQSKEAWIDEDTLQVRTTTTTPLGELTESSRFHRKEPSWVVERPLKDLARDLPAWQCATLGGDPANADLSGLSQSWREVGESYLLEAWLGFPFFDFYACAREGGFQRAVFDFMEPDFQPKLAELHARYREHLVRAARAICEKTPLESLCIGCCWSCNSLIGPAMWRRWDKPVIQAVAEEVHRHGRLLHIHFHGKCLDTVADFAEIGIDCVCPFERPPGGDIRGLDGLRQAARLLQGRTTMNGNVHTVETLIRGKPADVRREVREILEAFQGNPRVIVGTGDQVGRETPEENLHAMIEEVLQADPGIPGPPAPARVRDFLSEAHVMNRPLSGDGVHAMIPRDRMPEHVRRLRDAYAITPGAPLYRREFYFYTMEQFYQQGLPRNADLAKVFHYDPPASFELKHLGWCEAEFFPAFEEKVVEDRGDHEVIRDAAGRKLLVFKNRRQGFMPGYLDHPVKDRRTWEEDVKWRLDPDAPGRFAYLDPLRLQAVAAAREGQMISQHIIGGYMYLRSLFGPEGILYALHDVPELVHDCMRTWLRLAEAVTTRHQQVVTLDEVFFGEDICYNHGPLCSPEMIREFLFPYYQQFLSGVKSRQIDKARHLYVHVDTDGRVEPVIPLYIEALGMDVMSPFEVASGCDVVELGHRFPGLAMFGGIDKRELAIGPNAIDRMVERILPAMRQRGGFIPTCDHGVPEEVSLANYLHYRQRCVELGG